MLNDKVCLRCGETRIEEFGPKKTTECKKCRKWILNRYVSNRRRVLKRMAVEFKGGKCQHCGYDKCIRSLTFHHLDPAQKEFALSPGGIPRSWEKVKAEIEKCILVCSNCHGEIHAEEDVKAEARIAAEIEEYTTKRKQNAKALQKGHWLTNKKERNARKEERRKARKLKGS